MDLSRVLFEQFSRGDFKVVAELPDEFELVLAPEMPDAGTYRGAAARDWLARWVDSFDRLTQEPVEIIDAGEDRVLAEFIQRGWTAGSADQPTIQTANRPMLRTTAEAMIQQLIRVLPA